MRGDGVLERRAGRVARQHADRREHDPAGHRAELGAAEPVPVLERAGGGAVGDERLDVVALGGDLDQDVGARREAERADAVGVDVVLALEERERAGDVLGPVPAVVVLAAVALAAAARVVEQDAVAVAREHLRVRDRAVAVAAAAVHDEHGGAVLRRAVPAGELEPVAGLEADVAIRGARRVADRLAPLVRARRCPARSGPSTKTHAEQPAGHGDQRGCARLPLAAMAPRDRGGEPEQHDAGGDRERAGDVAAGGAVLLDVDHVHACR